MRTSGIVLAIVLILAGTAYGQENATGGTEAARSLAERVYLAYASMGAMSVAVSFEEGSVLDMSVAEGLYKVFRMDKAVARRIIGNLVQQMREANPSAPSPLVRILFAGQEVIRGEATASGVKIKYAD